MIMDLDSGEIIRKRFSKVNLGVGVGVALGVGFGAGVVIGVGYLIYKKRRMLFGNKQSAPAGMITDHQEFRVAEKDYWNAALLKKGQLKESNIKGFEKKMYGLSKGFEARWDMSIMEAEKSYELKRSVIGRIGNIINQVKK